MKRSVRIAAKTVNVSLIVLLICAFGLAALALLHGKLSEHLHDRLTDIFGALLALTFVLAFVSGFHIAVSAALDRMKDKSTSSDRET